VQKESRTAGPLGKVTSTSHIVCVLRGCCCGRVGSLTVYPLVRIKANTLSMSNRLPSFDTWSVVQTCALQKEFRRLSSSASSSARCKGPVPSGLACGWRAVVRTVAVVMSGRGRGWRDGDGASTKAVDCGHVDGGAVGPDCGVGNVFGGSAHADGKSAHAARPGTKRAKPQCSAWASPWVCLQPRQCPALRVIRNETWGN